MDKVLRHPITGRMTEQRMVRRQWSKILTVVASMLLAFAVGFAFILGAYCLSAFLATLPDWLRVPTYVGGFAAALTGLYFIGSYALEGKP